MRWIRSFLLALLFSLLMGFAIGTWLRMRMERSPVYIGAVPAPITVTVLAERVSASYAATSAVSASDRLAAR